MQIGAFALFIADIASFSLDMSQFHTFDGTGWRDVIELRSLKLGTAFLGAEEEGVVMGVAVTVEWLSVVAW